MNKIDEYLAGLPETQKKELERIRNLVKQTVPEAEEVISYDMPTFKYHGKPLMHFSAFKDHMSVFPASGSLLDEMEALQKFRSGKGTLQFTESDPISDDLLKDLLAARIAEIDN